MGQSTDAILYYGCMWNVEGWPSLARLGIGKFDPPQDDPSEDEADDDGDEPRDGAEKEYLRRKGLWQPTRYGDLGKGTFKLTQEQNYARYKELEPTIPFEVVRHCSHECPMYGLAIRGTVTKAWRGGPKQIEMSQMLPYSPMTGEKHAAVLREVCAVLKLQQPDPYAVGWWLVSDWS